MWLREGMTCLAAADRFLSPTLLDEFPWLALIRCVARRLRLQFEEARASHVHLVVLEQVQVDFEALSGAVGSPQRNNAGRRPSPLRTLERG